METSSTQVKKIAPGLAGLLHRVKVGAVAVNDQAVAGIYEDFFRSTVNTEHHNGRRSEQSDRRLVKRPS